MKTIYIVRHAKSSWEIRDLPDEKRPLLEKGITRTKKIARELKRQEVVIDHILCSSAVRSLETAKLLAEGLKIPGQSIEIIPEIYEADSGRVIEILSALPDNIQSLALVGHNPSVTDLVNLFISLPLESLPTSGVVSISFNISKWIDQTSHLTMSILSSSPTSCPDKVDMSLRKDYFCNTILAIHL